MGIDSFFYCIFSCFSFLLLACVWQMYLNPLPGQIAVHEIDQNESYSLQIIPATLVYPKMSVYGRIADSPSQGLVLFVRNVLMCLHITVSPAQPKVNQIHDMRFLLQAN
jgi:hypothetical protein